MDSPWLDKARAARNDAWESVQATPDFIAFKAFDDAVVAMGGSSVMHNLDAAVTWKTAVQRTVDAAARRLADHKKLSQGDAAEMLLRQKREPMSIARLMDAVVEKGAEVGGNDPLGNFRSTVSKDPRFHSLKHKGMFLWWLVNENLPPNWNEPESDDFERLIDSGSFSSAGQKGGEASAPTT